MSIKENRPGGNGAESRTTGCSQYIQQLRQRRAATCRLPVLDCGHHADPWTCRHDPVTLTDQDVDGYRDAAQHLLACGLTPAPDLIAMRVMWRRGGADRDLVRAIAERWETAA